MLSVCEKRINIAIRKEFRFVIIYRVYKKKLNMHIWNRSQRREAAQSMTFFINIDYLGTHDVE